jgi:hypothetical protein
LTEKNRENFLKFVGQNDTLDEFQEQVQNSPEFDATAISGTQSKSFQQLWDALKARQKLFYGISINSAIKFLEHSSNAVSILLYYESNSPILEASRSGFRCAGLN